MSLSALFSFEAAAIVASVAICISMMIVLIRLFVGPTLYDRVLAVNSFGTKTVLLIAVMNFLMGRPDFLDLALLYALINFVGTVAILKFFRYRAFNVPLSQLTGEENPEALQLRIESKTIDIIEIDTTETRR